MPALEVTSHLLVYLHDLIRLNIYGGFASTRFHT